MTSVLSEPAGAQDTTAGDAPRRLGSVRRLVADTSAMIGRSLRLVTRDVDSLIMAVVLPVMLLLLFTFVLGGAMQVGSPYLQYATPGIILLCAGFGAANTAVAVQQDMTSGFVDRYRSMPVAASAALTGHVVASLVKNLVTTAVVFGVATAMGFRADADLLEWIGAVGIIAGWVIAVTWLATWVGVLVRTPDAASGFTFFVMFLPYVSSAFVPPETMPSWLRGFAEHQPVTAVIESIRGLLSGANGVSVTSSIWLAVAWSVGIAALFAGLSAVAFRRRGRR